MCAQLQKDPEKLSSTDQIARLHRPGAKYFNMNPFEVLGLRHTASLEEVRKAYRKMSVQARVRPRWWCRVEVCAVVPWPAGGLRAGPLDVRTVPSAGSSGQEPGQRSRAGAPAPLTKAARAAAITPRATTRALFPRKSTRPRVTPSQPAFEIVKAAHERLEDEERMAFCQRICGAAQDAVEKRVRSAKKKLAKAGEDDLVPEDDPARMELAIKVMISRMFAEFEQRKAQLEERDVANRKKAKEEQARASATCTLYCAHVAAAATWQPPARACATWQRPSRVHRAAIALACTRSHLRSSCLVRSNPSRICYVSGGARVHGGVGEARAEDVGEVAAEARQRLARVGRARRRQARQDAKGADLGSIDALAP